MDTDAPAPEASPSHTKGAGPSSSSDKPQDAAMDVDNGARASPLAGSARPESEKKDEPAPMQADDEEAVEY